MPLHDLTEHFFFDLADQRFQTHNAALARFERFAVFAVDRSKADMHKFCLRLYQSRLSRTAKYLLKI